MNELCKNAVEAASLGYPAASVISVGIVCATIMAIIVYTKSTS